MKKIMVFMSFLLLASVANEASAVNCQASNGYTRVLLPAALRNALRGNFVCASRGGDTWRECHGTLSAPNFNSCAGGPQLSTGGPLWDLKLGNNPVDPSQQVGTWTVPTVLSGAATVTYDYGTGGSYTYSVWRNGATYDFCGTNPAGNNIIGATVQSSPCP